MAFACFAFGNQIAKAGIVVDGSGVVTSFSTDTLATVYLYQGSYTDAPTTKLFDADDANSYASALATALNNYGSASSDAIYAFVFQEDGGDVLARETASYPAWSFGTGRHSMADTSQGSRTLYYASTTAPSGNVPEPSTAIAMGLLGVLGFAGNRRRRRQS